MADYDIEKAFKAIEDELIASMMRNIDHHRAEETAAGYNWEQWQVKQLEALEMYKKANVSKFTRRFSNINAQVDAMISAAKTAGETEQEQKILRAIKRGFTGTKKVAPGMEVQFFRLNDAKLNALIDATTNDLQRAEHAMLRFANDQYRKIIFNAQVYANTGGTYEKAVDMATKAFLSAGINCIQYSNGSRHNIKDYAKMAVQTANKRAYLTGEGQKRQEWGIATVRINKRTHACPKCLPFVGKVLIDDVWSGGKADGVHMTMSYAMSKGLYHPNCRDIHTTYFDGISREPVPYTQEEVDAVAEDYRREQETNYAKHQAEKYDRLSKHSLDKDNQKKYGVLAEKWEEKVSQEITEVRELPKFTSEKTIDEAEEFAKQFVDVSQLSCQEHHTELGTFKKRIYADENMRVEYQTNLKDKFSHGRKDAQKLFNKYVPSDSVVRWDYEDIAKYEDGKIYMHYGADSRNERGIGATWFHEHGHLIDDKLGNISNDKNFAKILEKDANTYRVQYGKKYKLNTYDKVDRAISNELSEMRKHSAVSDLFEGITKGNIRGVAGHAKIKNGELDLTYWEKEGMLTSEAFAHMFEAQFDETRYNEMKKYFPNALKYFEEMIGGVV